ncbi:dTDP-4-dehydrorhamnose reductase [Sulfitobacter sp. D35]|uniref:dTDP-4-dehydrorhamnose reductase n=1 Tax=Sulfitobacter sp. D35 TaxID=3083252 RepID=UPI00296E58E9|nr:dTDP-4-dehydrorhamnose reductase [Sulfitobacter sp. D35]MDW4498117.1 dTDP-4-dehydrorhamnose reductase [Sulfitobacter sp. D35]
MKLLVFGKTGQVATELRRHASDGVEVLALGREDADFSDPARCVDHVERTDADAVIIAAAYTAVDKAESEEDLALTVNASTPGAIARACAVRDLPVIYVSTDYVFDGAGTRPSCPEDPTGPLGAYGRTKLRGEEAVRGTAGKAHAILRTSWVFSAHGGNFVKTMLRLGAERDRLTIVADQVGGPTPAAEIASACTTIARALAGNPEHSGTYHFSGAPDVSWADFAREIFAQSGLSCEVADIPTRDYPTPAQRPLNSRIDCARTTEVFGIARPDWRKGLAQVLAELDHQKADT